MLPICIIVHKNSLSLFYALDRIGVLGNLGDVKLNQRVSSIKTLTQKATFPLMLIAASFTVAKTWKQRKCPLTGGWVKKLWYI